MNSQCIHCNIYFLHRSNLLNRKKALCRNKIFNMYPVNLNCTNLYCNTLSELNKYIKNEKEIEKNNKSTDSSKMEVDNIYDADLSEDEFQPGVNYDNWDIEPNTKVLRKKKSNNEMNEIQDLFKNCKISERKKRIPKLLNKKIIKKRKNMRQLKITQFDVNNLFNNLKI